MTLPGGDTFNASFNAQSYSARLESGYHIALSALTLTPYAALQVQDFEAPAYGETAGLYWMPRLGADHPALAGLGQVPPFGDRPGRSRNTVSRTVSRTSQPAAARSWSSLRVSPSLRSSR